MTNAPGWYPDPTGLPFSRYWNGLQWTEHTSQQPTPSYVTSPLPNVGNPAAVKPWYRRKGVIVGGSVLGAIILIGGIASALSPTDDKKSASSTTSAQPKPRVQAAAAPTSAAPSTHAESKPTSHSAPPPVVHSTSDIDTDGSFPMPNEVGQVLQAAQDDLQRVSGNPIYFSFSHDLLGSRMQILDQNWQVCTQNVRVGESVTGNMEVDFGVVKLGESCP